MSDTAQEATGIKAQYGAQVASDLDHNVKEQERIRAELAALEERLRSLRHDQTLLLGVQQALGAQHAPADAPHKAGAARKSGAAQEAGAARKSGDTQQAGGARGPKAADVPKPRSARAASKAGGRKKAPAAKAGTPDARPEPAAQAAAPTLVTLVREHLAGHTEPRSAAEVAAAVLQAHPGRGVKTTVVRTTLEGLVAKGQAQRAKQGSSVFYTAAAGASARPAAQTEAPTA